MGRTLLVLGLVFSGILAFTSAAFPWGLAGHAYIADRLKTQAGIRNLNEIYGSMVLDFLNTRFDLPVYDQGGLYEQLHFTSFMSVWENAKTRMEQSGAAGFLSHNNLWGADCIAHGGGVCLDNPYEGYIINKATDLDNLLPYDLGVQSVPPIQEVLITLGFDEDTANGLAPELYHSFVEAALDIVTAQRRESAIGEKITQSAIHRNPRLPGLLAEAFAEGFAPFLDVTTDEAKKIIRDAEKDFRMEMIAFGQILSEDLDTAVSLNAEILADQAEGYLGIAIPLPKEDVVALISGYLWVVIKDPAFSDYSKAITSTIQFVQEQLQDRGIVYRTGHGANPRAFGD
jgi:hypothetical protein